MWHRKPKWKRFARYAGVGLSTLIFDLILLYIAVSLVGISYVIATPIGFLIAISINYVLSRRYVFRGTERNVHTGYARFVLAAVLGAAVTTLLVAELVSQLGLYYLFARILVAGIIGIANYIFNLYFNFKVVGKHS